MKDFSSVKELIVVNKSTVPPGTTEKNEIYKNLNIVFNPEFLTERNAVRDYDIQERIIIGGPRPATTTLKIFFQKYFLMPNY